MINYFKTLGASILKKDGYFNESLSEIEKKKILLKYMMIVPESKKEDVQKAIALCFDTEKKEFWFELDKEIDKLNAEYFFAFAYGAKSNTTKLLFSTLEKAGLESFFGKIIENYYKVFSKKHNYSDCFKKKITEIQQLFYLKIGNDYQLNPERLREDQKNFFFDIKSEKKEIGINDKFLNLIKNKIIPGQKDFSQIVLIKIDGKTIMEDENLKDSYLNVVWNTFMKEEIKNEAVCHICNKKKKIVKEVEFPFMKFYGTTNGLFFENLKDFNSNKSFSSCSDCINEVLVGMSFIERKLRDTIFGINAFLIPKLQNTNESFAKDYRKTFKLLKNEKEGDQDTLQQIDRLLEVAQKENFYFDLLFYEKNKAEFDVIKTIPSLEYKNMVKKFQPFEELNKKYALRRLNSPVDLNFIRNSLYMSAVTHGVEKNGKYEIKNKKEFAKKYRKELLELIDSLITSKPIKYNNLIKMYVGIYYKKFLREKDNALSTFKMNLVLKAFNNIRPLKGVRKMEGKAVTIIQNQRYNEFFNEHSDVYCESFHRQGLFLLGTVINKILWEQKGKSSNFLKKLNLKGIHPRRIQRIIGEVKEYGEIYKIFEEPGIWGNILDRLQGVETSTLTPEEVVFYMLSGISFEKYEAFINGNQKNETISEGEDNDNN